MYLSVIAVGRGGVGCSGTGYSATAEVEYLCLIANWRGAA